MFQHKNQYADRLEYGNICNKERDFLLCVSTDQNKKAVFQLLLL